MSTIMLQLTRTNYQKRSLTRFSQVLRNCLNFRESFGEAVLVSSHYDELPRCFCKSHVHICLYIYILCICLLRRHHQLLFIQNE